MDIKKNLTPILPTQANQIKPKTALEKTLHASNTTDRDGNGQTGYDGGKEQQHPPMTEEELLKAMEHLKQLAVVKDNNLTVTLTEVDSKKIVLIAEPGGKVVRRIPESELWSLSILKDSSKAQLLSKVA